MTNREFLKVINNHKLSFFSKSTIQAVLSCVSLSIEESIAELDVSKKTSYADKMIILSVMEWERIKKTFDIPFPTLFIQSAILGYCGKKSIIFLDRIGLGYDIELAELIKGWLVDGQTREVLE